MGKESVVLVSDVSGAAVMGQMTREDKLEEALRAVSKAMYALSGLSAAMSRQDCLDIIRAASACTECAEHIKMYATRREAGREKGER